MKTVDISGVGGEFEFACQRMLMAGISFLKEHPQLVQKVIITDEVMRLGKELDEAVVSAGGPEFVAHPLSHATFDMVMKHLSFIKMNGLKKWFDETTKDEPERIFEFDGTLASIPKSLEQGVLEKTNADLEVKGVKAKVSGIIHHAATDNDWVEEKAQFDEQVKAHQESIKASMGINPEDILVSGATTGNTAFEKLMEEEATVQREARKEV